MKMKHPSLNLHESCTGIADVACLVDAEASIVDKEEFPLRIIERANQIL